MPTSTFARTIAYFYFMRFGIVLWMSMLGFIGLDLTPASTATRGILTLDAGAQMFWAAFQIVIAGWVALLSSRVVCAYGEDRFGVPCPPWFCVRQEMSWLTFVGVPITGFGIIGLRSGLQLD